MSNMEPFVYVDQMPLSFVHHTNIYKMTTKKPLLLLISSISTKKITPKEILFIIIPSISKIK